MSRILNKMNWVAVIIFATFFGSIMLSSSNVYASELTENNTDFEIYIDANDSSQQEFVVGDLKFVVLANDDKTRASGSWGKEVAIYDFASGAYINSVLLAANGMYDGSIVSINQHAADKMNNQNDGVTVTKLPVSGNFTSQATISASVKYTASNGKLTNGTVSMYIRGNGQQI